MAKAKKSKAKKSKVKKPVRNKAKIAKRAKAPARARAKAKKAAPRKAVKAKKAAPKKMQKGEGDYAATRAFDKDQANFVKRNKAKIPQMGRDAAEALDGPEGAGLKAAEQEAMDRSTID